MAGQWSELGLMMSASWCPAPSSASKVAARSSWTANRFKPSARRERSAGRRNGQEPPPGTAPAFQVELKLEEEMDREEETVESDRPKNLPEPSP